MLIKFCTRLRTDQPYSSQNSAPFIGLKAPFVGSHSPHIGPYVCQKRPFVLRPHYNSGFTLVELIVTLVVAGILVSLAVPSFTTFIKNNRLTSQANELMADLSFARSEAIKRGASITICKSQDPLTACNPAAPSWSTGWLVVDGAGAVLRVHDVLAGQNTLTATGGATGLGDQLVYTSTGMADSNFNGPQFFRLCDDRGSTKGRAIQVAITGRPGISDDPPVSC